MRERCDQHPRTQAARAGKVTAMKRWAEDQYSSASMTVRTRVVTFSSAAEIVLAVRVVVRREGDEAVNAPHDLDLLLRRHRGNARR